jgi:acyl carrier protein
MLTASLKAFKKKAKPGSQASSSLIGLVYGSKFFARQLFSFSSPAIRLASIDPGIESQVLAITQAFLHNCKSKKTHRLSKTVTFASLGLDSVATVDLVIELEEKLGLNISNKDADIVNSVYGASLVFSTYAQMRSGSPKDGRSQPNSENPFS